MIFGKKTVSVDYGGFESEGCLICGAKSYRFVCKNDYAVLFGAKAVPLGTGYEAVCDSCADVRTLPKQAGRDVAKQFFAEKHRTQSILKRLNVAAILIVVLLLAALPFFLTGPSATPQLLKSLVEKDGLYSILNFNGDELGIIEVQSGEKRLKMFNDISVLKGEPGADGSFYKHDYFTESFGEAGETVLERNADSPGFLKDRHGMIVRQYSYNKKTGNLGYMRGVQDLSAIKYEPGKAIYPFVFYVDGLSEPKPITFVLYILGDKRLEAMYTNEAEPTLVTLTVSEYENGRVSVKKAYYFEPGIEASPNQSGLTPDSRAQDYLDYIDAQKPEPMLSHTYKYFENSHVLTSITIDGLNSTGQMQSFTQDFEVSKNGRFYIQILH